MRRRIAGVVALAAIALVAVLLVTRADNNPPPRPRAAIPRDDLERGVRFTLGDGNATARALATQPDGTVAVAATTTANGRLGTTIVRRGPHGERLSDVDIPGGGEPYDLEATPDGGLVVLTREGNRFDVAKITARGAIDRTFGDPALSNIADGTAGAVTVGVDGQLAIVSDGAPAVVDVTRLSAGGRAPSSTEVSANAANLDPREQAARPASPVGLIYTSDGGLLVGAASPVGDGATAVPEVIRVTGTGGVGGVTIAPAARGRWVAFTALSDGSTIVAGSVRDHGRSVLAAVKFTSERLVDRDFGDGGLATLRLPADAYAGAVVADPRGGLVFGVNTSGKGRPQTAVVRLRDDGAPDPTFTRVTRPGRLGGLAIDRSNRLLITTSAFDDGRLRVWLYRQRV